GSARGLDTEPRLSSDAAEVVHPALAGTDQPGRERASVTPENRDQMLRVLRENLARAHLPAATPEHPPPLAYGAERSRWSHASDTDTLVKRFRTELEALSGRTYLVESVDEAAGQIAELAQRANTTHLLGWDAAAFDALGVAGLIDRLATRGI